MARVTLFAEELNTEDLPEVCMRCGEPADAYVVKTFTWREVFTPWLLLGAVKRWRLTLAIPLCRGHVNFVWGGLGGMRVVGCGGGTVTLTGVAEEFVDALDDYRDGRRPRRVRTAVREREEPRRRSRPPLDTPPPPRRQSYAWLWVLLSVVILLPLLSCVGFMFLPLLMLRVSHPMPATPVPVAANQNWPNGNGLPGAPGEARAFLPEVVTLFAAPPNAGFPGDAPWAGLVLNGGAPLHLLSDDDLDKILNDLQSISVFTASDAAKRLANAMPTHQRRPEVTRALETMLLRHEVPGREAAAQALGVWGTAESVPALIRTLNNEPFPTVRASVMDALAALKDERGAKAVARRLTEFPDQEEAAKALEKMGPVAEQAVLTYLTHQDAQVRLRACRILEVTGTRDSVPALKEASKDKDGNVALAARDALQAIQARP